MTACGGNLIDGKSLNRYHCPEGSGYHAHIRLLFRDGHRSYPVVGAAGGRAEAGGLYRADGRQARRGKQAHPRGAYAFTA